MTHLDPNRGTGRTTRMVKEAVSRTWNRHHVAVVFRTKREAYRYSRIPELRNNPAIRLFALHEIGEGKHHGLDVDYVYTDHHVFDKPMAAEEKLLLVQLLEWANMVDVLRFGRQARTAMTATRWQRIRAWFVRAWLRFITFWMLLVLGGCVTAPPLTALDAKNPWSVEVLDFAADWEAHPDLPTLDTPLCRRYIERARVVHTTEQEFGHHTGYCPMTVNGCSTMGTCPGDRCVTGAVIITGGDIVTIFLSPGEDASGHLITVRHEMAHALFGCTTGSMDYGHTDRRVWDGVVWQR